MDLLSTKGANTTVTVTSTSTSVLTLNSRVIATFTNSGSVTIFLALGFTPTTSAYTVAIAAGAYYELPAAFAGPVNAITASASGTLLVTELT